MFAKLGVFASMALAAGAVLVPPNFTADSLGDDNAMETLAVNPFKRTVALECPGCAYASSHGKALSWTSNTGSSFLLDFEVGPREDTLDIDGVQLYPPTFGHFSEPFYVTQVNPQKESDGLRLRVTGYTFHYNSAETVTEAGTELLPMTFKITSIESRPVDPPALTINLLKDVTGRLMIASFQTTASEEVSPIDQELECKEWPLLCKWRAILADRINNMKNSMRKGGCHKRPGNPMESEIAHGNSPHTFRPGHKHPHGRPHHFGQNGHRHHHHHRMHMFLRRAFFTIIIPILVGIFAGTLTYLVGMAIGCLIAVVIAKIRGRAPYERIAEEDDEEEVFPPDEKEVFAEPPKYDAPPVYEEAAEKEVVNKEEQ